MEKSGTGGIVLRHYFQEVAFRLRAAIRLASEPVSRPFGEQCLTKKLTFAFKNVGCPACAPGLFRRIEAALNGHCGIWDDNLIVHHKNRGLENDEATSP